MYFPREISMVTTARPPIPHAIAGERPQGNGDAGAVSVVPRRRLKAINAKPRTGAPKYKLDARGKLPKAGSPTSFAPG